MGCGWRHAELLAERYWAWRSSAGLLPDMLQVAKERLAGFANVSLEQGDAMHLGYADGSFDCVVSAFALRNMASCERAVGEIARVLRPGGVVCCMDSFVPECRALLPLYRLYFKRLMPLIGGGISRRREYDWLCRSTEDFVSAGLPGC
ncbi:MAG: class I SAM-dependent methyltransferase [Oscillospiraceae bacterium]